jgi:hypothetical protein
VDGTVVALWSFEPKKKVSRQKVAIDRFFFEYFNFIIIVSNTPQWL